MSSFYYPPTTNAFSTTLNGSINDTVQTITLNSVTGLQNKNGVLVLDRQDSAGSDTPSKREYISFTGVSGSTVTGVTRGFAGSTAQSHADGALVEAILDVIQYDDLVDIIATEHLATGKHLMSSPTLATPQLTGISKGESLVLVSIASIQEAQITNLSAGVKGQIFAQKTGALVTSLVTSSQTGQMGFVRVTKNLTINGSWAGVMSAPSLGVAQFDWRFYSTPTSLPTTIHSTKPTIDVGEYESSTAAAAPVVAFTSLASGTLLKPEILAPQGAGELLLSLAVTERK